MVETLTEVCDHGRPVTGGTWWRGIPPCDDCEREDWERVKHATVIGVLILVSLIVLIPACMLLAGMFWG